MSSREYRAVFGASALSWFGDYAARAAVTALVYLQTQSVAASAATFAISYLPWLGIGSVLTALAERYPYRRVMIVCDLSRLVFMAFIAFVDLPVWALMALLFCNALLNPPFDAARSALLPQILSGDRYVVGLSIQKTTAQAAQIIGYLSGAAVTAYDAKLALLINAATFGISAFAVGLGVHERPPALRVEERTGLLRETAEGYSVVFRAPVLRGIALIVFGAVSFGILPEGLAAAWAAQLTDSVTDRGWYQGAIMMSAALGFVVGSIIVARFVAPSLRVRLIRPFAVLTPLALVPALLNPSLPVLITMIFVSGFTLAGLMPAANGLFVQALPAAFRARAFGVMQSGLHLLQGAAVLLAGWLASMVALPQVVGVWSIAGVLLMTLLSLTWPSQATIKDAIAANRVANAAQNRSTPPVVSGRDFGEDTVDLGASAPRLRPAPSRPATGRAAANPPAPGRAGLSPSPGRTGSTAPNASRSAAPPAPAAAAPAAAAPQAGQP